jgi:TolB protein
MNRPTLLVISALASLLTFIQPLHAAIGDLDISADVGKVSHPGTAKCDKGQYTVSGSGANIWKSEDAFQFVYKKMSGDLTLEADISFVNDSKQPHRKAGWMVRQSLDADSPYVDVMVHGDGHIALQTRGDKAGDTTATNADDKAPARVRLVRQGDNFEVFVAAKGQSFTSVDSVTLKMTDPVYVGLAVCAHDADAVETATFSNVVLKNQAPPATTQPAN